MAWCCQATSHYLSQCWPRSMSPYGITRPQWVKELAFPVISLNCKVCEAQTELSGVSTLKCKKLLTVQWACCVQDVSTTPANLITVKRENMVLNTRRAAQNDQHFVDGTFKFVFLRKQGKSDGSDSCDPASNLTQIGFKSLIIQPLWPCNLMDDLGKL